MQHRELTFVPVATQFRQEMNSMQNKTVLAFTLSAGATRVSREAGHSLR
jgi:hypothetical protein